MNTCAKCQFTGKKDEFSHHSQYALCWRCCPVPAKRIETKQLPRVPGTKL